ncbi:hypothetical protein KDU71_17150 [Carboxylicivirga sediminis]|uniref:Uncharacterized protein n=1 Tax=Carboxylicivirga sediminis TaxID=2006564 RepID=A0A941IZE9_9BACT|nr:hypothetical protein [Carboxylicivirga sediminis]MBR8537299.1 hypothetical protein [Carboxylicivirga sediminis]
MLTLWRMDVAVQSRRVTLKSIDETLKSIRLTAGCTILSVKTIDVAITNTLKAINRSNKAYKKSLITD